LIFSTEGRKVLSGALIRMYQEIDIKQYKAKLQYKNMYEI